MARAKSVFSEKKPYPGWTESAPLRSMMSRIAGVEDRRRVEVALGRGLAPERVRLVRQPHVERVPVELRVDGDGGDAQLAAGPDHPDRDLPPVGDEDLLQHVAPFGSRGTEDRRSGAEPTHPKTYRLARPVG
jgi:hypothetical protein